MVKETEQRELACQLTPAERDAKTVELVRLEQRESHQKADKKAEVAKMNAELKQTRAAIDALVKQLDEGMEVREVAVEHVFDYGAKRVDFKRTDTGAIIESRPMDQHDLQTGLPGVDKDVLPPPKTPKPRKKRNHGVLTDVPDPGAMKAPESGENFRNAP